MFDNLAQYAFSIQSPCSCLSLWLPLGVRTWFHIEIQNEKGIDLLVQCGILFLKNGQICISTSILMTLWHCWSFNQRLEMYFFKPLNLSCAMWLSLASGILKNEMQTKTSKMFAHWDFFCFESSWYHVNKHGWMCCRMRNQYPNHPRCGATGCVSKSNPWSPTKSWTILSGCHFKSLSFGVVLMVQQIIHTRKWSWVLV